MAQELVGAIVGLLNPVVFIPIILIFSIFFLIGMAIMGWDKGAVLVRMGHRRFARGLITYLFAVTTIGTVVVVLVGGLLGDAVIADAAWQRGKEVLSLLMGVFGTIVGYYFGSEAAKTASQVGLSLTSMRLGTESAAAGESVSLTAAVVGRPHTRPKSARPGSTTGARSNPPLGHLERCSHAPVDSLRGCSRQGCGG